MTTNPVKYIVVDNPSANRFEAKLDEEGKFYAVIDYQKTDQSYTFLHTGVPPEYRGQGIADLLAHEALETVNAKHMTVVPLCPFIKAYIARHKEYEFLVARQAPE